MEVGRGTADDRLDEPHARIRARDLLEVVDDEDEPVVVVEAGFDAVAEKRRDAFGAGNGVGLVAGRGPIGGCRRVRLEVNRLVERPAHALDEDAKLARLRVEAAPGDADVGWQGGGPGRHERGLSVAGCPGHDREPSRQDVAKALLEARPCHDRLERGSGGSAAGWASHQAASLGRHRCGARACQPSYAQFGRARRCVPSDACRWNTKVGQRTWSSTPMGGW